MSIEQRVIQAEKRTPVRAIRPTVPEPLNIVDFAINPDFLGVDLYPKQGTILKVLAGDIDLLTDFDRDTITEWEHGWELVADGERLRYVGTEGTPPGLLARLQACKDEGRSGPSEIAGVIGRRGSKGVMTAILVADLMHRLLRADGVLPDSPTLKGKTLVIYVMGAKYEQAKRNAFADIKQLIEASPAFRPFLGRCTDDSVTLLTPSQIEAGAVVGRTAGRLEVRAVETTPRAGRGPTMVGLVLDEFAHVGTGATPGSNTSSIDIYRSAKPALAQFPRSSLTLQTSSPWEKDGQLYASYQLGCELDRHTLTARVPSLVVLQLPSWVPYEQWEQATSIPMWPDGPTFPAHDGPVIDRAGLLERYRELDPVAFDVEYGAQFAASVNAYLNPRILGRLVEPYRGQQVVVHHAGINAHAYVAHGDPARVGDNFGFAIGHREVDEDGIPHVFIDDGFAWHPADFPDHTINYIAIESQIQQILIDYPMSTLTFDQYASAGTIDHLRAFVAAPHSRVRRRTDIFERTATAPFNWKAAEVFKMAAMLGLVHIPTELAEALSELEYLQVTGQRVDHPTHGPVRHKDIADAVINVTYTLIGDGHDALFERLGSLGLRAHPGIAHRGGNQSVPDSFAQVVASFEALRTHGSHRGHGAPRGSGYDPARGDRRGRGRHW